MRVKYIGNVDTLLLKSKETYEVAKESDRSYEITVGDRTGRYSKKMFQVVSEKS